MSKLKFVALTSLALLTACASPNGPVTVNECAGWRPITISLSDVLTEETARGILAHNEYGRERGCW